MSYNHHILKELQQNARTLERTRIQISNRMGSVQRGDHTVYAEVADINALILEEIAKLEKMVDVALAEALYEHPLWDAWLSGLYGVGRSVMPQILALLLPPLPDRGPSTWFKAAGLIPEEQTLTKYVIQNWHGADLCPVFATRTECQGEWDARARGGLVSAERGDHIATITHTIKRLPRARAGGPKLTHHVWLRRCLWLQSRQFVMVGKGYYRTWYDTKKRELTGKHAGDPDWPQWRLDAAARWSMMRLFLSHLYERWAEVEGFPSRKAYVVERLGHHYLPPPAPLRVGGKLVKT